MRVLGKRLLIKPDVLTEKTAGGVYIPTKVTKDEYAKVIAVGDVQDIAIGDTVFYKAWAVDEVTYGDETFTFLDHENVLATVPAEVSQRQNLL